MSSDAFYCLYNDTEVASHYYAALGKGDLMHVIAWVAPVWNAITGDEETMLMTHASMSLEEIVRLKQNYPYLDKGTRQTPMYSEIHEVFINDVMPITAGELHELGLAPDEQGLWDCVRANAAHQRLVSPS